MDDWPASRPVLTRQSRLINLKLKPPVRIGTPVPQNGQKISIGSGSALYLI